MVKVQVPATSANLGSGFDALGVAMELYNTVSMEESDKTEIKSLDNIEVPTDKSNLIYKSAEMIFDNCGRKLEGLKIHQTNNIPLARGLGSSSACIIGGMIAANEILGSPMTRTDILEFATKLEGHPDNVAPALLGGLVSAVLEGDKVWYVKEDLKRDIQFVVIIPNFELKTSDARNALPEMVSHADARYNLSRSALMALSIARGQYQNLRCAAQDKLHQPYRFKYIPFGERVVEKSYSMGAYASMISGAGSTLISIVDTKRTDFVSEMRKFLDDNGLSDWRVETHKADNNGAIILEA